MPLTDIADLMDQMMVLLAAAPCDSDTKSWPEAGAKSQSLLALPSPELNAPVRRYSQVYGDANGLLKQLSLDATAEGASELSNLLSTLDQKLCAGAFELPSTPLPAPRLGRYVYPVV